MVTGRVEWMRPPECILCRVCGIKMRARNPALRHELRGRMGPPVMEQLREDVRVRSRRTVAVGGRNRLIHLDPPQLAHEHTMRVRGEDHAHRRVARVEQSPSRMRSKFCRHIGIGHTDADIDLQGAKTKIEQRGVPMLFT